MDFIFLNIKIRPNQAALSFSECIIRGIHVRPWNLESSRLHDIDFLRLAPAHQNYSHDEGRYKQNQDDGAKNRKDCYDSGVSQTAADVRYTLFLWKQKNEIVVDQFKVNFVC